jgi:hypothetical protein
LYFGSDQFYYGADRLVVGCVFGLIDHDAPCLAAWLDYLLWMSMRVLRCSRIPLFRAPRLLFVIRSRFQFEGEVGYHG